MVTQWIHINFRCISNIKDKPQGQMMQLWFHITTRVKPDADVHYFSLSHKTKYHSLSPGNTWCIKMKHIITQHLDVRRFSKKKLSTEACVSPEDWWCFWQMLLANKLTGINGVYFLFISLNKNMPDKGRFNYLKKVK